MNTQCSNTSCEPVSWHRPFTAPARIMLISVVSAIGRSQRLHLVRARLLARAVNARYEHGRHEVCCDE